MYICNIKYIYNIISKSKQYVYNFFYQKFIQIDRYVCYKSVYENVNDCINNTIYIYLFYDSFLLIQYYVPPMCNWLKLTWKVIGSIGQEYTYIVLEGKDHQKSALKWKKKKDWLVMKTKMWIYSLIRSSILSLIKTIHYCFLK